MVYCGILWYTVIYCDILWYTVNILGVRSWMGSMLMVVVGMKYMLETQAVVSVCVKCVIYCSIL